MEMLETTLWSKDSGATNIQDDIRILEVAFEQNRNVSMNADVGTLLVEMTASYNALAFQMLRDGLANMAVPVLVKAHKLLMVHHSGMNMTDRLLLEARTFTNLAFAYRCMGSPMTALYHIRRAFKAETRLKKSGLNADQHDPLSTLLNICALQSELGRHFDASRTAKRAIKNMKPGDGRLPVAFYNLAVEYEHLRESGRSREALEMAITLSDAGSRIDNGLTKRIKLVHAAIH